MKEQLPLEEQDDELESTTSLLDALTGAAAGSTNVLLIAQDGDTVPASRFVLAVRSPVLLKVLYGSSRPDQRCSEVRLEQYSGAIVRALVENCRTNDLQEFFKEIGLTSNNDNDEFEYNKSERIREVVHLCHCARCLEVEGLEERACELTALVLEEDLRLACAVYDEALGVFSPELPPMDHGVCILAMALDAIRTNPQAALLHVPDDLNEEMVLPGVTYLGRDALREILSDGHLDCDEIVLFGAVHIWSETNHRDDGRTWCFSRNNNDNDDLLVLSPSALWCRCDARTHAKRSLAKSLVAEHIDLRCMAPSDLLGPVLASGLVKQETVFGTLEQMTHIASRRKPRRDSSRLALVNCFSDHSRTRMDATTEKELIKNEDSLTMDEESVSDRSLTEEAPAILSEQDEKEFREVDSMREFRQVVEGKDEESLWSSKSHHATNNKPSRLLSSLRCTVPGLANKFKRNSAYYNYDRIGSYNSQGPFGNNNASSSSLYSGSNNSVSRTYVDGDKGVTIIHATTEPRKSTSSGTSSRKRTARKSDSSSIEGEAAPIHQNHSGGGSASWGSWQEGSVLEDYHNSASKSGSGGGATSSPSVMDSIMESGVTFVSPEGNVNGDPPLPYYMSSSNSSSETEDKNNAYIPDHLKITSIKKEMAPRTSLRLEGSLMDDFSSASESSTINNNKTCDSPPRPKPPALTPDEEFLFGITFPEPTATTAPRSIRKAVSVKKQEPKRRQVMAYSAPCASFDRQGGCDALNLFP